MDVLEQVAAAMDAADHGYHIRLKSLTDEGSVYTLDLCDGLPLMAFGSHEDALDHARRHRALMRARAAVTLLRPDIKLDPA